MRGFMLVLIGLPTLALAGDSRLLDPIVVDLGSSAPTMDYNGALSQRSANKVLNGAAITVSNPVGTTVVRCVDTEFIEARLDYRLEGSNGPQLEAYGNGLKMQTTGNGTTGSVTVVGPSRPATMKASSVDVIVMVPQTVKLTVKGGSDWVQVSGCSGNVAAWAGKNGIYVDGALTNFDVSAGTGDVKVNVSTSAGVGIGKVTALAGNAEVTLPQGFDGKVDVRGASVNVQPLVAGSVGATVVTGTIGLGKGTLTVKASADVMVKQ